MKVMLADETKRQRQKNGGTGKLMLETEENDDYESGMTKSAVGWSKKDYI